MLVHVRTGMWIDNLKITGLRAGAPHKALGEIMNPHKSISYFESKVNWCINMISEVPWIGTAASHYSNMY